MMGAQFKKLLSISRSISLKSVPNFLLLESISLRSVGDLFSFFISKGDLRGRSILVGSKDNNKGIAVI